MSNRYGRNQKRQAKATIAALQARLATAEQAISHWRSATERADIRAMDAQRRAYNAESEAFNSLAAGSGMLNIYVTKIAEAMGAKLADELRPVAEQILAEGRHPPRLRMEASITDSYRTIHAEIPSIRYSYAFHPRELADTLIAPLPYRGR